MKPILIIRTGRAPDSIRARHGDFPHWFRLGTRLLPQQLRIVDVAAGELLPPPQDVAGAMITGSAAFRATVAAARSPLVIASSTLRTEPRRAERRALLTSVRRAIWRVALRADLVLAIRL